MSQGRLVSLDAFRGLTIAAMLLVNNPGRWSDAYIFPPLRHARWHGCSLTDLVFPFFLFIAGVSLTLSLERRGSIGQARGELLGHVLRRVLALGLLGLYQNRFPLLPRGPQGFLGALGESGVGGVLMRVGLSALVLAVVVLLAKDHDRRSWGAAAALASIAMVAGALLASPDDLQWLREHLSRSRVPSVLGRIGACYLIVSLFALRNFSSRALAGGGVGVLLGYAMLLLYLPVPGFGRPDLDIGLWNAEGAYSATISNAATWIDTRWLGIRALHFGMENGRIAWAFDPEGILSTIPACVTMLLGLLYGRHLRGSLAGPVGEPRTVAPALRPTWIAAALLIAIGLLMHSWIPINKRLWTSSYVLFTGGAGLATLGACRWLIDERGLRGWSTPFVAYGHNALAAFLLSSLFARLLVYVRVQRVAEAGAVPSIPLQRWLFENLFEEWSSPRTASLLFALSTVIGWALIMALLHRRRIHLKL